MRTSRRELLRASAVGVAVSTAGCSGIIEGLAGGSGSGVQDVLVENNAGGETEVQITATADDGTVALDESLTLAPDGEQGSTEEFADPLSDGVAYTIVVETGSGLRTEYDWEPESDDDGNVIVRIHDDSVEVVEGNA